MNRQEMQQRLRHLGGLLEHADKVKQMAEDYGHFLEGEDGLRHQPGLFNKYRVKDIEDIAPIHRDGWHRVSNIIGKVEEPTQRENPNGNDSALQDDR